MSVPAVPDNREPWEPQPGETARAWEAFVLYRDLGPARSLSKVATILKERTPKRGTVQSIITGLARWSPKYEWVERSDAYDLYLDRLRRDAEETELQESSRREAQIGRIFQQTGLRRIKGEGKEGTPGFIPPLDPAEMDASDVVTMVAQGVRIERLAHGQPTDLIRGQLLIAPADLQDIVGKVMDEALVLIPDEKREQFIMAVRRIGTGR